MINKKEIGVILLATIILALVVSSVETWQKFLFFVPIVFAIIIINVIAKKVASFYLDSEVEIKLWEVERYWFRPGDRFKKPFPMGIIAPIILKVISMGYLNWTAATSFDVKPKTYRAAKRFGLYTFSEMSEFHIALIAAAGIIANLFFAAVAYFIGIPEFSRLSVLYAFFNMLPLSDLDGNKMFFGSMLMWSFLFAVVLIGVFIALFVI